jgi:hypothetical protein
MATPAQLIQSGVPECALIYNFYSEIDNDVGVGIGFSSHHHMTQFAEAHGLKITTGPAEGHGVRANQLVNIANHTYISCAQTAELLDLVSYVQPIDNLTNLAAGATYYRLAIKGKIALGVVIRD